MGFCDKCYLPSQKCYLPSQTALNYCGRLLKTEQLHSHNVSGSLPSWYDFLKTMIDWHEEYLKAGHFNIPLDHEQSEYLSWLATRLAAMTAMDGRYAP